MFRLSLPVLLRICEMALHILPAALRFVRVRSDLALCPIGFADRSVWPGRSQSMGRPSPAVKGVPGRQA